MREPMMVDRPGLFPFACSCGNGQGPMLDTFFENAVGRLYVCKRCAKAYARLYGFSPGKRLDQLDESLTTVGSLEAELVKAQASLEEAAERERLQALELAEVRQSLSEALERERTRAHLDAQLGQLVTAREQVGGSL